jgi:hypothetical protein
MPGDVSRSTFSKSRHYRAVRNQQGRVVLDADWNEQADITAHRFDTEALDLVGRSGVPKNNAGFLLSIVNGVPVISAGRAYVDGIVCENEADALALTAQPDLPNLQLPTAAGRYLAYLDVWEREITALDDPNIREVALGGADTCTRRKTVWQVKLLAADAAGGKFACGSALPAFDGLSRLGTGTLAARVTPAHSSGDPFIFSPAVGYTGLQNQLYRVEVLAGGAAAGATFTWARDNASNVAAWSAQNANVLTVSSTTAFDFSGGQWVELTDDTHVLTGARGLLVRLVTVSGATLTIDPTTATAPVDINNFPLNPKIVGWSTTGAAGLAAGTWIALENGIGVQFSDGAATYRPGDYWLIPARSGVGILWPADASNTPLAEPPHGIAHHYARLATADFDGKTWTAIQDCRPVFPSLSDVHIAVGFTDALHVQQVFVSATGGTLANDSSLSVLSLVGGLQIVLDRPPEPLSIKPVTCFLTLAMPFPLDATQETLWGKGLAGTVPLVLDGLVTVNGAAIEWTPSPSASQFLAHQLFAGLATLQLFGGSVLARLTLKGSFIWLQGHPDVHLDGTVFGTPAASGGAINIGLPSDGGRASGDFELWFHVTSAGAVMTALNFLPNPVEALAGHTATATLTLSQPAPPGGYTATISVALSTYPPIFFLPNTPQPPAKLNVATDVTVPAGQLTGVFPIQIPTSWLVDRKLNPNPLLQIATVTATNGPNSVSGKLEIMPNLYNFG